MSAAPPLLVRVVDPESGDTLDEHSLDNDFLLICHGSSYLAGEQHHATTGTTILTIKRRDPLGTPGTVSADPAGEETR